MTSGLFAMLVGLFGVPIALVPAAMWASDDMARGLLGFWSLLIGPTIGALLGTVRVRGSIRP